MRHPFSVGLLVVGGALTLLMFAAPFAAPPSSMRGLDGHVNFVDQRERWSTLHVLPAVAYAIGDLTCHQMEARSWTVNGNQFPLDARMLSALVTANVGFMFALLAVPAARQEARLASLVPRPRVGSRAAWLLLVALAPTALDGFAQLLTAYESTNLVRFLTGSWLGVAGGLWLATGLDALWMPIPRGERPLA